LLFEALAPRLWRDKAFCDSLVVSPRRIGFSRKVIREEVLGPKHPDTVQSLNNLALLYYQQGQYQEAEPLLKRALEIREEVLSPKHPDTAESLNNLAVFYLAGDRGQQGRLEEAETLLKRALEIREKVLGPKHPDTVQSLNILAALYREQGRLEEAKRFTQ
jgi:tetratricopeptide (TPR) repeat protein